MYLSCDGWGPETPSNLAGVTSTKINYAGQGRAAVTPGYRRLQTVEDSLHDCRGGRERGERDKLQKEMRDLLEQVLVLMLVTVRNSPLVLTSHWKLACSPSFLVMILVGTACLSVLSAWSQKTMLPSRMRTIGTLVIWEPSWSRAGAPANFIFQHIWTCRLRSEPTPQK